MTNPRDWLGKGLQDVPGRPFGWAWNMERDAIREHLLQRGFDTSGRMGMVRLADRVSAIQQRIHRYRPTYAQRVEAWKARQRGAAQVAPDPFTRDELLAIRDRFAGANDQLGQEIHRRAAALARHLIGAR